jgi:hypothetical protein
VAIETFITELSRVIKNCAEVRVTITVTAAVGAGSASWATEVSPHADLHPVGPTLVTGNHAHRRT